MTARAGEMLVDEIVPRIVAVIPRCVKLVGCEDVEEVTQDAIAMAAKMLDNVEKSGKPNIKASHIAYYCLQHIKSGRRSVGNSVVDVLATGTQLHGKCIVESLEEINPTDRDEDDSNFSVAEMVSQDTEDPSTRAGREVDWERFLGTQDDCSRNIVHFMAEGRSMTDVARESGIGIHIVQQSKNRLANDLREFFGDNILAEIAHVPGWKAGLLATRERHAAKH